MWSGLCKKKNYKHLPDVCVWGGGGSMGVGWDVWEKDPIEHAQPEKRNMRLPRTIGNTKYTLMFGEITTRFG